jgi:hypothetical protein
VGLKLNRTHHLLVYADNMNLLVNNIHTTKETMETLIDASKEVGLEVNTEKTMLLSHHQNAGQNYDIKIADRCFENAAQFRYLGTTITNQNLIQEEMNLDNACYHSMLNILSSWLLSKNIKVRIYKTINLPVVLFGCETCSMKLRKEHKFKVFEKKVLRRIFGPKRD